LDTPDEDWSVILVGRLSTCYSEDDRHEWTIRTSDVLSKTINESVMDTDLDKIGINQKNKQKIKAATVKTNIHSLLNILKAYNANTHQDKPKLTDTEGTGRLQLAVDTRQTLGKRPPSTPPKTTSVYIHKNSPLPEKGKNGSPKNTEPYRTHEHPPQFSHLQRRAPHKETPPRGRPVKHLEEAKGDYHLRRRGVTNDPNPQQHTTDRIHIPRHRLD
jgi:hypothetical protein